MMALSTVARLLSCLQRWNYEVLVFFGRNMTAVSIVAELLHMYSPFYYGGTLFPV
jgi:hypothetical protein